LNIRIDNAWRQLQAIANSIITMLPNFLLGILFFALFFGAGRYVAKLVRSLADRAGQGASVGLLLGRAAHYVIVVVGLLVAMSIIFPSFKAGDLIQVLGIGGVAIGFAFKDIFQNFLAGVIILISRPFRIGDKIVVKGFEGTVEDIQTRATMLRTFDHRRIVIPNTVLFTEVVTVTTAFDYRRSEIDIVVGHEIDIEQTRETILQALADIDAIAPEPRPDVLVVNFTDTNVTLRIRWWISPRHASAVRVQDRVVSRVQQVLRANPAQNASMR